MKKSKNAAQQPEFVYIRVRRAVVLPIQTAAINLPLTNLPSTASGHMYLIEGTLEDIRRYAGATIDWVIKIANSSAILFVKAGCTRTRRERRPTGMIWTGQPTGDEWYRVIRCALESMNSNRLAQLFSPKSVNGPCIRRLPMVPHPVLQRSASISATVMAINAW